jgi:hypothetical protein
MLILCLIVFASQSDVLWRVYHHPQALNWVLPNEFHNSKAICLDLSLPHSREHHVRHNISVRLGISMHTN